MKKKAQRFEVILAGAGEKKIHVIKEVSAITGLGLMRALHLVKAVAPGRPRVLKRCISQSQARAIKTRLEEVGATVILQGKP